MQKILVVEDEEDLLRGLEMHLRKEGYRVVKTGRGDTAVSLAVRETPDLVILDVMLPGMSGLEVCRELRQRGFQAPIILLTAKSEEIDRVVGLEIGADDYVTKPFSVRELMARVKVRLRRQPSPFPDDCRFGEVEVDFLHQRAARRGQPVELSPKEYEILRLLVRSRGEVVSRDRLLNEAWGYEAYPSTRTVDTHIMKLRQKLEADPANPQHILSVYGEGYKFVG